MSQMRKLRQEGTGTLLVSWRLLVPLVASKCQGKGDRKMPPENMPLWQKEYFRLKATGKQRTGQRLPPSRIRLKAGHKSCLCRGEGPFVTEDEDASRWVVQIRLPKIVLICINFPTHLHNRSSPPREAQTLALCLSLPHRPTLGWHRSPGLMACSGPHFMSHTALCACPSTCPPGNLLQPPDSGDRLGTSPSGHLRLAFPRSVPSRDVGTTGHLFL